MIWSAQLLPSVIFQEYSVTRFGGAFRMNGDYISCLCRRFLLALLVAAGWLLITTEVRAANVTQIENTKLGSADWELTNPATNHEIEGYASLTSVNRGSQISFFVNTSDPT